MAKEVLIGKFSDTSPTTAAGAAASAKTLVNLDDYTYFMIDAHLIGATGGATDVVLQRYLEDNAWADWLRFTRVAAGAAAAYYTVPAAGGLGRIVPVGRSTDSAFTIGIAENDFVGGHPGKKLRVVYVPQATVTVGAAQVIRVYGWTE